MLFRIEFGRKICTKCKNLLPVFLVGISTFEEKTHRKSYKPQPVFYMHFIFASWTQISLSFSPFRLYFKFKTTFIRCLYFIFANVFEKEYILYIQILESNIQINQTVFSSIVKKWMIRFIAKKKLTRNLMNWKKN